MKIRIKLGDILMPHEIGKWQEALPSCALDFNLGQQDHHQAILGHGNRAFETTAKLILTYSMFPTTRLRALLSSGAKAVPGATVVQHVKMAIFEFEMANRVVDVFEREKNGVRETGLTIVSLAGHPEQGVETFLVRQNASDEVSVHIIANSRPGHWMSRLFTPWVRRLQLKATRECMEYLRERCR